MKNICDNNITAEKIFKKRIEQNSKIFTQEEKKCILKNLKLSKKLYFLGLLDSI